MRTRDVSNGNWKLESRRQKEASSTGSMWLDWGAEWNAGSVFFHVVSLCFQRANTSLWIKQCCLLGTELEKHPGGGCWQKFYHSKFVCVNHTWKDGEKFLNMKRPPRSCLKSLPQWGALTSRGALISPWDLRIGFDRPSELRGCGTPLPGPWWGPACDGEWIVNGEKHSFWF